ncbi:hypothetical protein LJR034_004691 [Caballeronia sp. LjRoot34]|uniref:hypothetical protein n=1 Tax=Caballeronia sp. LjRoot34 TaxID=3342325 RepID=UPI003ED0849A
MDSNNPNHVLVQPIRSFQGAEGFKHPSSPAFPVSRGRAAELKANGLVREADGVSAPKAAAEPVAKKAPEPQNKMTPDPQNKSKQK